MRDVFCKIASGELPTKVIYEDDDFIAFPDINPKAKVHILIATKKHISSIANIEESDLVLLGRMFMIAKKIAHDCKIDLTGYRLVINSGRDAGQSVEHLHMHILGGEELSDIG